MGFDLGAILGVIGKAGAIAGNIANAGSEALKSGSTPTSYQAIPMKPVGVAFGDGSTMPLLIGGAVLLLLLTKR